MKVRLVAVTSTLVLLLSGCSADALAGQYADGSGQGYVSSDGAVSEIPITARGAAIVYSGEARDGSQVSSADYAGQVYVVNFWYASCPPCRLEAPALKALSEQYVDVPFLGINIFDSGAVSAGYEQKYGIAYPSILDANTAGVQLAFAGAVAPNAVPTTLVIDRQGRVAARISGLIRDPNILASMIETALAEAP